MGGEREGGPREVEEKKVVHTENIWENGGLGVRERGGGNTYSCSPPHCYTREIEIK